MADITEDDKPPPSFLCPIMSDLMRDPVTCTDGHSYERANISRWLREHDTSPITGTALESAMLIPNHALRNAIEDWEDEQARRRLKQHAVSTPPQQQPSPPSSSCSSLTFTTAAYGSGAATTPPLPESSVDAPPFSALTTPMVAPPPPAPIRPYLAGQAVVYTQKDGSVCAAKIVAVHPGGEDDPTPFYTVRLADGTERDTVMTRLTAASPPANLAAGENNDNNDDEHHNDDHGRGGDATPSDSAPPSAGGCSPTVTPTFVSPCRDIGGRDIGAGAAAAEEEDARRQAVERSRLEAR